MSNDDDTNNNSLLGSFVSVTGRPRQGNKRASNGGIGSVVEVEENGNMIIDYVVEERLSQDVIPQRVSPVTLETSNRPVEGTNRQQGPGLLSAYYMPTSSAREGTTSAPKGIAKWIQET